jgi:cysteinyl-tRNA synthetase
MSCALLGEHFDIHGGGADLQFPHHENEIAQSEGAFGQPMVNYWIHNGFVRVDNEKMSKSLGNFFTIRDVLKKYDAEVVRFFILRAHYRSPLNYSDAHLDDAKGALTRLYTALAGIDLGADKPEVDWNEAHAQRLREAMDDDFNTPLAVAELFDLATEVNKSKSVADARQLKALAGVLGLLEREPQQFLQAGVGEGGADEAQVQDLIAQRAAAKKARNFAEADSIRAQLLADGIILEDKPDGSTNWRRA